MPAYTRGKKRNLARYVKANALLYYGFRTKDLSAVVGVSEADLAALGQLSTVPANSVACFGANAPKPPRVSKRIATTGTGQQSVSTFCSFDKLGAAIAAGWNLGKDGRSVGLTVNARTVIAVAAIDATGPLYAFPMNAADFASYGEQLGLKSAATVTTAAEINRLIRGSSYPRPGRAMKMLDTGGTVQTFFDYSKLADLQAPSSGWRITHSPRPFAAPTAAAANP